MLQWEKRRIKGIYAERRSNKPSGALQSSYISPNTDIWSPLSVLLCVLIFSRYRHKFVISIPCPVPTLMLIKRLYCNRFANMVYRPCYIIQITTSMMGTEAEISDTPEISVTTVTLACGAPQASNSTRVAIATPARFSCHCT